MLLQLNNLYRDLETQNGVELKMLSNQVISNGKSLTTVEVSSPEGSVIDD